VGFKRRQLRALVGRGVKRKSGRKTTPSSSPCGENQRSRESKFMNVAIEQPSNEALVDKRIKITLDLCRWFFGLWYMVFGLDFFYEFFPQPMGHTAGTTELLTALIDTQLFHIVKALELLLGALIFFNRGVPLALIIVSPISFVTVFVNWHLDHWGSPIDYGKIIAVISFAINAYMIWGYRKYYTPMLVWKSSVTPGCSLFK
jgi:hypothetical protein